MMMRVMGATQGDKNNSKGRDGALTVAFQTFLKFLVRMCHTLM